MRARSIAFALAAFFVAAPAPAAKPHRSIPAAQESKTLLLLDELARDQARRRQQIAMLQADVETHDRTDRTILLGAAGISGVVIAYALTKKKVG